MISVFYNVWFEENCFNLVHFFIFTSYVYYQVLERPSAAYVCYNWITAFSYLDMCACEHKMK